MDLDVRDADPRHPGREDEARPPRAPRRADGVVAVARALEGGQLQPTQFYAVAIALALLGGNAIDVYLAWAYVGLRVVHSIFQATVNKIEVRFTFFALSSFVLIGLTVRAVLLLV